MNNPRPPWFRWFPVWFVHSIAWFAVTRAALVTIGYLSAFFLLPQAQRLDMWPTVRDNIWLNMWMSWDSQWYLNIAEHWYLRQPDLVGQPNLGFFPLYSILIKIVHGLTYNYQVAGLLVANLALLAAAGYLYHIVRDAYDEATALASIKFLFIFPSSFVLSGVFSESTYLVLVIMSFYYAQRDHWRISAGCGALAALTRPPGFLLLLPLLYLYLRRKDFTITAITRDSAYFLLIPGGLILLAAYHYYLTGDWFAYLHSKQQLWASAWHNPMGNIVAGLFAPDKVNIFYNAVSAAVLFTLILTAARTLDFSYWVFSLASLLLPLAAYGPESLFGIWRFILPVFPVYLALARLANRKISDQLLTAFLLLIQGGQMVFWSQTRYFIV